LTRSVTAPNVRPTSTSNGHSVEQPDESGSWVHFTLCAAAGLALLALFFVPAVAPALLRAEHWAADWRTALLSDRLQTSHPRVAIIAITEDSVAGLPYILPVNRGYMAELVTAADQAGATAIGLDFSFIKDTEKPNDEKLLAALKRAADKVVLGVYEDTRRPTQLSYQFDFIERSQARAGFIDLVPEKDHVVRYRTHSAGKAQYRESFSTMLAKTAGWAGNRPPDRIGWLLPPRDGANTFLEIEAHKFLAAAPEQRAAILAGRVAIIGGKLFSLDRHWTPLSLRTREGTSGVDVHAHMAAELIDGTRSYAELGPVQVRLFIMLLACLGIILGARFQRRGFDFLDWRVASLAVIALDLILFRFFHLMLPFTLASVAWIAGVTVGTQLRRAVDWSRARWGTAP
jgi:adenylate cyclase